MLAVHARFACRRGDVSGVPLQEPRHEALLELGLVARFQVAVALAGLEGEGRGAWALARGADRKIHQAKILGAAGRGDVIGAVEHVAQLAHVARPVVGRERSHGLLFEADVGGPGITLLGGFEEVLDEHRDVVAALPEGRNVDRHHRETEVEILAELAPLDLVFEVALGGGHDARVRSQGLVAAHPPELLALEHAQELGLHVERKLADLVEEDGAAAGGLEGALARGDGAGERAALVAEELALDQVVADGAAVDDHEGLGGAAALLVDAAGQDVLARARLALEQHRGVGGRDVLQHTEERAHGQAWAQRLAELARFAGQDVRAVGLGAQDELDVAHGDGRARFDRGLADLCWADPRVIGRVEVLDQDAALAPGELAVVARDGIVGQDQIVVRRLADADPVVSHREPLAASLSGDDHQHQLVRRSFARTCGPSLQIRVGCSVAHGVSASRRRVSPPSRVTRRTWLVSLTPPSDRASSASIETR